MELTLFMILAAGAALLVRLGMAIHQAGTVRAKNSAAALVRSFGDVCAGSLAFMAVGAALVFSQGTCSVIGFNRGMILKVGQPQLAGHVLMVLSAAPLGGGIVAGVVAERSRFFPMMVVSAVLAGVIIPVAGYWVWGDHGWLGAIDFHDCAGASVVHVVGGLCAAVGVQFIGARAGKYNRDGSANGIPGHNVPMAAMGMMLMMFAWGGYVMGMAIQDGLDFNSRLGVIAINVLLAGAAGGMVSLVLCQWRYGKPDVALMCGGMLGGLVAISAGADLFGTRASVLVGAVAGVIVPTLMVWMDVVLKMDDPTGGIAVHAGAGVWGILAAGFLAPGLSMKMRMQALGVQGLGLAAIAGLAIVLSLVLFGVLHAVTRLRASEEAEFEGLDLAEHDVGAYPDFQQTMIKSYHLREV